MHQIQSGQVIVDLCSVVKELVENALDADANAIEIRFKNYGLDSIEVQDNGTGISETNYESLALKHYTSKLSTYDDLSLLQTFGFRGEALSSLCALSTFSVITAQAHEAPKAKRLEFEISGKLKSTSLVAAPKGTTVLVETLFASLPVRQKELSKNIKREYGKVLGLLHAYACISTKVKFTVKNTLPKSRSAVVFSTKGNATTRDNIANVYGAKMLPQLIELSLKLDFQPNPTQLSKNDTDSTEVSVVGHISRPVFGEGRQTPDRQMFFVNGRPCGLPQIAKAINEVYKSYNVSQSPFIFADFHMDTNNYDVNVSPDKRTILLHNAAILTDRLKEELTKLFDDAEQTVPQSQLRRNQLPAFRQLTVSRESSKDELSTTPTPPREPESPVVTFAQHFYDTKSAESATPDNEPASRKNLLETHFANMTSTREETRVPKQLESSMLKEAKEKNATRIASAVKKQQKQHSGVSEADDDRQADLSSDNSDASDHEDHIKVRVGDFNARMQDSQVKTAEDQGKDITALRPFVQRGRVDNIGIVPNAFNTMRPRRTPPEIATITIGDKVITKVIGTPKHQMQTGATPAKNKSVSRFSLNLRKFDVENEDRDAGFEDDGQDSDEDEEQTVHERSEATNHEGKDDSEENGRDAVGDVPLIRTLDREGRASLFIDENRTLTEDNRQDIEERADRTQEEYRVAELIRLAETKSFANSKQNQKRVTQVLKGSGSKDLTTNLVAVVDADIEAISKEAEKLVQQRSLIKSGGRFGLEDGPSLTNTEEERLSLTISKSDFAKMHIAGQFNLGFIIALRYRDGSDASRQKDELFIIDQHASDEKYNFERLQAETVVGNQRLVYPILLDLTAVEEEVVLENGGALQQNGFIIDADTSGSLPVGQRCRLLSLPLSKEVTFNLQDLEELIHLLSESHISADSNYVPRPGKVRKMFAMRACRSSIMIGKTLSMRQMKSVLEHMGRIDKPWNCPHGRPTMRHLTSLDDLDKQLWREGDGLVSEIGSPLSTESDVAIWTNYVA